MIFYNGFHSEWVPIKAILLVSWKLTSLPLYAFFSLLVITGEPWSVAWWTCRVAADVHVHLWVVDLVGQPVIHDFRQVPEGTERETSWGEAGVTSTDFVMLFLTVNLNVSKPGLGFWKMPSSENKGYGFPKRKTWAKMASELSLNGTKFSCRFAYK